MKKYLIILLLAIACSAVAAPTLNVPINVDGTTWSGIGVRTSQTTTAPTVMAKEYGNNAYHKTVLIFTAAPVVLGGSAGNILYGGVGTTTTTAIYTFPVGNIQIYGAEIRSFNTSALTCSSAGLATFTSASSLGVVTAANDATLTGTEANILASTANGVASAKIATIKNLTLTTPSVPFDGTTTAIPVFLNLIIDTDATNAAGTCTFTGTVTLVWANLTYN
jgi:hypothetical protein